MDKAMREAEQVAALAWADQDVAVILRVLQDIYRRQYPLFAAVEILDSEVTVYRLPHTQARILVIPSRVLYGSVGSMRHQNLFLKTPSDIRHMERIELEERNDDEQ